LWLKNAQAGESGLAIRALKVKVCLWRKASHEMFAWPSNHSQNNDSSNSCMFQNGIQDGLMTLQQGATGRAIGSESGHGVCVHALVKRPHPCQ
jgi:hypothetical protein